MSNFYEDNADMRFVIEHDMHWDLYIPLMENNFADAAHYAKTKDPKYEFAPTDTTGAVANYKDVYSAYAQIIEGELYPYLREMDKEGMKFSQGKVQAPKAQIKFMNALKEAGILSFNMGREFGGQNIGLAARMPISEMLARADIGTQIIVSYFNMSEMIEFYGDEDMKQKYLPRFAAGEMLGAMALTEPNIGSDLTNAAVKAVKNADGTFSLNGTKIFITQGCGFDTAGAAIFTIARSLDRKGAFGLSFFLVEDKDVKITRIEEKMGLHSSATCEVLYENSKGLLIGEEGAGLVKYAINMMNGARVGIACQSLGIAQAALSTAEKYSAQRVQFGVTINKLGAVNRMLRECRARVQATRALVYTASEMVDLYFVNFLTLQSQGADEKQIRKNEQVQKWDKLAKVFTPLAKFTASEFACKVSYDCMQIHGGVGYTEEYEIAKIFRDARITTIYEGTTQLQSIAIIGGIVEGINTGSHISAYFHEKLSSIKDQQLVKKISAFWNSLRELVTIYKEQAKEVKDEIALDLSWHFAYTICSLLLSVQLQKAKDLNHEIVSSKEEALDTFLRMATAQIAGGIAYVKGA